MTRKIILSAILFIAATSFALFADNAHVIDPSVTEIDGMHALTSGKKFWVESFSTFPVSDTGIGHTRLSRRVNAPIMCDPAVGDAVRRTLSAVLASQGALAASEAEADFLISGKVLSLSVTEESKFLHQIMRVSVQLEVVAASTVDPSNIRKLVVGSGSERTAYDTTKHAQGVVREALKTALGEVLKNIDSL